MRLCWGEVLINLFVILNLTDPKPLNSSVISYLIINYLVLLNILWGQPRHLFPVCTVYSFPVYFMSVMLVNTPQINLLTSVLSLCSELPWTVFVCWSCHQNMWHCTLTRALSLETWPSPRETPSWYQREKGSGGEAASETDQESSPPITSSQRRLM